MKRFLASVLVIVISLSLVQSISAQGKTTEKSYYLFIQKKELRYLSSMQLDNGAFPMTKVEHGTAQINPYFADFTALALLDAGKTYKKQVKRYIIWHMNHLNSSQTDLNHVDGTIYDYPQKQYDSTDSYAATFLCVLDKYIKKTGDKKLVLSYDKEVSRVLHALKSTMNHYLTYAKPDYKIKYLMDNCEVYEGLLAASNIYKVVYKNNKQSKQLKKLAMQVHKTIEKKLWNKFHYRIYIDEKGKSDSNFSWNEFYPNAVAQLFPITSRIIKANCKRAKQLYKKFNQSFGTEKKKKSWYKLSIPDEYVWSEIAMTAAMMKDKTRLHKFLKNYRKTYSKHQYPLFNADIARVAMACGIMAREM